LKEMILSAAADEAEQGETIINANGVFIGTANFEELSKSVLTEVRAHHKSEPLSRGLARELLREQLFNHSAPEVFRAVMNQLESKGGLVTEKDLVRLSEHTVDLSTADTTLREKIAAIYQGAQLEPPTLDQAFASVGVTSAQRAHARKILQMLLDSGTLVRVQADMFLHVSAIDRLRALLRDFASQHEPERLIDVAQFKTLAGVSRKYAIPLLEFLDSERITRRAGDKRIIL
jgi:selenocysteine-specific elongation factor